ncbi:MAG: retropepsin-like aspartic protease [Hadesarchaea archaeon]|nr:retropepsin-like aspartic protease [Hadesarchaea archaeon]
MRPKRRPPSVICRYLSFTEPKSNITFRLPLVHTRLKSGGKAIKTIALIDSGATDSFVPLELIEILGLRTQYEQAKEIEVVGAGGVFKARKVKIDLIEVLKSTIVFCDFRNIEVLVLELPYTILGRNSIFQEFDITFREKHQHIIFRWPPKK